MLGRAIPSRPAGRRGGWVPDAGPAADRSTEPLATAVGHGSTGDHSTLDHSGLDDSGLDDSRLDDSGLDDSPVDDGARIADPGDDPATVRSDPAAQPGSPPPALDRASRVRGRRAASRRVRSGGTGLLPARLARGRVDLTRGAVAALLAVALVASCLAGLVVVRGRPQVVEVPQVVTDGVPLPGLPSPSAGPDTGAVVVAVAGKVVRPGVVELPSGSRVDDAVRAAGGVLPGASPGLLNLARRLVDGEQILVGIDPPPGAAPAAAGGQRGAGGLLDLNVAAVGDLDALPGIGPVLAQRIVDWREEHGRFESIDQLREVTGIGEAKYGDLQGKVSVG